MSRRTLALQVFLFFCLTQGKCISAVEWEALGSGNLDVRCVALHPDDPRIIYIGSRNRVLKSLDRGFSWRCLLSVNARSNSINFLYIDPKNSNSVYAATSSGLFFSPDQGKGWQRVFKGRNQTENDCRSLTVSEGTVYLATTGGLFLSKDKHLSWQKITWSDNQEIFDIAAYAKEKSCMYISCGSGVFRSLDQGNNWKRIFFVSSSKKEESEEGILEEEQSQNMAHICVSANAVYLATATGVYKSIDRGESWSSISGSGFNSGRIRLLAVSASGKLYAINSKRVFEYSGEFWEDISSGLGSGQLYSLGVGARGDLYLASYGGLFRRNTQIFSVRRKNETEIFCPQNEPLIKEVQEAAIQYAEVSPEKIAKWRKQAARRALLPQMSVGLEREASSLWHWESGSTTKCDDDTLRKGRDYIGWDVTLSWNLAELLWNNDQTSIDSRSKLMVELRDDILDNVTKLYFERLRLKMEIENLPLQDTKRRMEKELKVREISASLDALTGGYFSKSAKALAKR